MKAGAPQKNRLKSPFLARKFMSNFSMLEFMKCTEFSMIFSGVILKRGVDYSIEFDSRVHIEFISRVI